MAKKENRRKSLEINNSYSDSGEIKKKLEYCKGCFYLGNTSGFQTCDYILIEEHSRGCPAGKECTKKKIRKKHMRDINFAKGHY